jgi:hypothetical protein
MRRLRSDRRFGIGRYKCKGRVVGKPARVDDDCGFEAVRVVNDGSV